MDGGETRAAGGRGGGVGGAVVGERWEPLIQSFTAHHQQLRRSLVEVQIGNFVVVRSSSRLLPTTVFPGSRDETSLVNFPPKDVARKQAETICLRAARLTRAPFQNSTLCVSLRARHLINYSAAVTAGVGRGVGGGVRDR